MRIYNPKILLPKQKVFVYDRGRWLPGIVDSKSEFGWTNIVDLRNRSGCITVRNTKIMINK